MLHVEWYHVCWPRLTAKRVEPVVSISWASCCTIPHYAHLNYIPKLSYCSVDVPNRVCDRVTVLIRGFGPSCILGGGGRKSLSLFPFSSLSLHFSSSPSCCLGCFFIHFLSFHISPAPISYRNTLTPLYFILGSQNLFQSIEHGRFSRKSVPYS